MLQSIAFQEHTGQLKITSSVLTLVTHVNIQGNGSGEHTRQTRSPFISFQLSMPDTADPNVGLQHALYCSLKPQSRVEGIS